MKDLNIQNLLSRREFLKLTGLGALGTFLPPFEAVKELSEPAQVRVIYPSIKVYNRPSFSSREVRLLWKDTVLLLTGATIGDREPAYNRVWYRIGSEGYAHSGGLQPVMTRLQPAIAEIPLGGTLAEVTVPFTDVHWGPGKNFDVAYRFYYETTHWVTRLVHDSHGNPWYQVQDDKWEYIYYAPSEHLRLLPAGELTPISPEVPVQAKRIEVRLDTQMVLAYEWDRPVFAARAATGAKFSNGNFFTPTGRHLTFHKRPSRHMATNNLAANGFDLPGVPWVCYITKNGVAFHGTYWHNDYGQPRSHGCINLTPQAAKWIYRWTLPVVPAHQQSVSEDFGTAVDVL